jgi:methionine synthase II (cobalamin-independent)
VIRRDILIEDLVTVLPESVRYLMNKGIRPIVCGEPLWDTLEGAARLKRMSDQQIDAVVTDLADIAAQKNQVKKG